MKSVSIKPNWTLLDEDGAPLPPRLIELLVQVQARGSLQAAAQALGLSYRHAWDLVRQGEAQFRAPLVHMARGKGSHLSPLGEKIAWADHRIVARLRPALDSLASELASELDRVMSGTSPVVRIHASHGFAIERLVQRLDAAGVTVDIAYASSVAAAAALSEGQCELAGLHIPNGPVQAEALAHYAAWLADDLSVIDIAQRRQGLMVAAGNPKEVFALADLARPDVRFINRQAGSGTRFLLEALLGAQGISPARIAGFETGEFTHAAVAAYVASGMADAAFGLEPPARQFKLDFIPMASERYFLLCRTAMLDAPGVRKVLDALQSPALRAELDALPGYDASRAGLVTPLREAYPSLADAA